MEAIWTESAEAILAEQSWSRSERERHQRLLHQLKLEFQQERARARKTAVAPAVVAVIEMATPAPTDDVTATQPESAESARKERLFRHPKKSLPPVQIL